MQSAGEASRAWAASGWGRGKLQAPGAAGVARPGLPGTQELHVWVQPEIQKAQKAVAVGSGRQTAGDQLPHTEKLQSEIMGNSRVSHEEATT